jgi:hypothetical protein
MQLYAVKLVKYKQSSILTLIHHNNTNCRKKAKGAKIFQLYANEYLILFIWKL